MFPSSLVYSLSAIALALSANAQSASSACSGAPASKFPMLTAAGWSASTVLGGLTTPRGIVIDANGNLLVVERGKGVTGHTVDVNGCVKSSKTIIADTSLNHGIDVNKDGNKLIVTSADTAWSWDYDPSALTVSNQKVLVTGMDIVDGQKTRTVLVSRKHQDLLIISAGSLNNFDEGAITPSLGRAQIRVFDMSKLPANGTTWTDPTYGKLLGYGLRNNVGMADDRAGLVHSVENSLDGAVRVVNGLSKDIHNDNPGEPLFNLGDPTAPKGLFGGSPYCSAVWEPKAFEDASFKPGDWFVQQPNNTINDAWCATTATKPTALLPPHTAPLDMTFGSVKNDENLYVSLHGSWNRDPPQGYKVVLIPGKYSSDGEWTPIKDVSETQSNFVDVLGNGDEKSCQAGQCFRPVGLALNTAGDTLYVSSDTSGEVFLLKRTSAAAILSVLSPSFVLLPFVVFSLL